MLHARDDLLTDVAAFVEIDPAQLIHQGFVREGVAEGEVLAAFRNAERDAVSVVGPLPLRRRAAVGCGDDGAPAERGQARIVADEAGLQIRSRGIIPAGKDARGARAVLDGGLGAQPVEAEPLGEVSRFGARAIEMIGAVRSGEDDEIEQDLALRAEQGAEARPPDRDAVEIAGQKAVEKAFGLLARNLDDAAVGETGHRHHALLAATRAVTYARRQHTAQELGSATARDSTSPAPRERCFLRGRGGSAS